MLLYILLLAGGYAFLYSKGYIGPGFFEHVPPSLELVEVPTGIGTEPARFRLNIDDAGAGIDQIVIRGQQAKKKFSFFEKIYKLPQNVDSIEMTIAGQEAGLRDGDVSITFIAFDRSFFNNKASRTIELPVNYRKPRIEVLSAQHNVNQGGMEFAFYKLADGTAVKSGIRVGNNFFSGFPARLMHQGFENMPEIYCSFFAVPTQYDSENDPISAYASNAVGNTNFISFYYHVIPRRFGHDEVKLTDYYMREKLQELYLKLDVGAAEEISQDSPGLLREFRKTVDGLHASEEKELRRLSGASAQKQLWKVPFIRPIAGATRVPFGERRHFVFDGEDAGTWVHPGMDLSSSLRNPVFAANDGQIAYVNYFGTYGNTVIIDHGFGLFSIYGHLSSTSVTPGAAVQQGTEIGKTGTSGLADGDSLHFEMRVQGVPVNPVEWWDTRWIKDHIIAKVQEVLTQAGSQPADEEGQE